MAVGALEPQFYDEFVACSASPDTRPRPARTSTRWGELRDAVAARFKTRTRDEWTAVFEGTDACVAPVLSLREAPHHPHLAARGTFIDHGGITQPAPAPRFSATPGAVRRAPARPGADTADVARDWGVPDLLEGPMKAPKKAPNERPRMKRQIFTAEHEAFRETVRTFLAKEVLPHYEQWEKDGIVSREAWRAAGKQGLLGLAVPEEYGGRRARPTSATAPCWPRSSPGRARPDSPLGLHNDIIGPYLTALATEEQKRRWLPGFCSGEIITAIAMTEPGAGSDLQGIRTHAEDRGRPLGAQRLQDLHLQRHPRRPGDRGRQDDARGRGARTVACWSSSAAWRASSAAATSTRSARRPRTPPSCSSTTCASPRRTCSASGTAPSST